MADGSLILIADGCPGTLPKMDEVLRSHGYLTSRARDTETVVSLAGRLKPSALVLGLHLPGGGAAGVLRRLRNSLPAETTPMIVLANSTAQRDLLLSEGATRCLETPVRETDILIALTDLLREPGPANRQPG